MNLLPSLRVMAMKKMESCVRSSIHKFKIFNPIIIFYSIFMMYNLFLRQASSYVFFHYKSVLKHISILNRIWVLLLKYVNIASSSRHASIIPTRIQSSFHLSSLKDTITLPRAVLLTSSTMHDFKGSPTHLAALFKMLPSCFLGGAMASMRAEFPTSPFRHARAWGFRVPLIANNTTLFHHVGLV